MRMLEAARRTAPGASSKSEARQFVNGELRVRSSFDFRRKMLHGAQEMASEEDRTRLIGQIACLLREGAGVPDDARAAALTLIGWLARRMPGEAAHRAGVAELTGRSARVLAAGLSHVPLARRLRANRRMR